MSFPNAEQQTIIDAVSESLLVLAPMGTGKTRTAAASIARAIDSGVEPEKILGLTFTHRAAEAMRAAVFEQLPEVAHRLSLFNLHGLCVRLLREEAPGAGLPVDFTILDEEEADALLWGMLSSQEREERFRGKEREARSAYENLVYRFLIQGKVEAIPDSFKLYRDALRKEGSIDFIGLIARVAHLLRQPGEVSDRWKSRFDWILVDEVQDINLAEYELISSLARRGIPLKFFGDPHQTIFEWRHARPVEVFEKLEQEYHPRHLALIQNYRCSPEIVEFSNRVREQFIPTHEPFPTAVGAGSDGEVTCVVHNTEDDERAALIQKLRSWHAEGLEWSQMAVLARENRTLGQIAGCLEETDIPYFVQEEHDLLRRQEIKVVLATLQWLVSPFRRHHLLRLLKHFGAHAGNLAVYEKQALPLGLHVGYWVRTASGDPFAPLLNASKCGGCVGMDTETTGLDPMSAEVIQFARSRMEDPNEDRMVYFRPDGKVGESYHTHHLSDEFLREHGVPLKDHLLSLLTFREGDVLIGHNLAFDLRMLDAALARIGAEIKWPEVFDTMPLSSALLADRLRQGVRLEAVMSELNLTFEGAHDALADVKASLQVLQTFLPQLEMSREDRLKWFRDLDSTTARALERTRDYLSAVKRIEKKGLRVSELIQEIWVLLNSQPGSHFRRKEKERERALESWVAIAEWMESRCERRLSLPSFVEKMTLGRRDMGLLGGESRVRLLSAHAAKGLEFDAVALPGLVTSWRGTNAEEARVFYVMVTRARNRIWMSYTRKCSTYHGTQVDAHPLPYLKILQA